MNGVPALFLAGCNRWRKFEQAVRLAAHLARSGKSYMYLQPSSASPVDLADLAADSTPAFFLFSYDQSKMLVVAGAAVFLERFVGEAILKPDRGDWTGLLVRGAAVEVDATSYSDARPSQKLALQRKNTGLYLKTAVRARRSFAESHEVAVVSDLPSLQEGRTGWFGRWRLTINLHDEPVVLFQYDGTDPAEAQPHG